MKYTVENIQHVPSELDDDMITLDFEMHFTEPEEIRVNYSCSLDDLLEYVAEEHEEFYDYYDKVHTSLDKWGPAEKQTLEALGSEALDQLYEYLREYITESGIPQWAYDMGVKIKNTTPEEREKQAKAMQDVAQVLTDGFVSIKETTNRHRLFCELADRKLREIAVEVFPEITDLDPEELKEFRYFFTDEVTTMSERLDLLLGTD